MLLILALLNLLHQVVRGAIRQRELRQAATALQTATLYRCKTTHERQIRDSCLRVVDATTSDIVPLHAVNALTVAALEQPFR